MSQHFFVSIRGSFGFDTLMDRVPPNGCTAEQMSVYNTLHTIPKLLYFVVSTHYFSATRPWINRY